VTELEKQNTFLIPLQVFVIKIFNWFLYRRYESEKQQTTRDLN